MLLLQLLIDRLEITYPKLHMVVIQYISDREMDS